MSIQFKPEAEAWRGPGRPQIEVPQELVEALERTYRDGTVAEDEAAEHDPKTWTAIRLMRIHCERQGKKLDHQFFDRDGKTWLRFRMRDTRSYTKTIIGPNGPTRKRR